ncbi:hypothetical protein [Vibrio sp. Vb339]|uniref:hypothetical protein n=1 Tax=Vibrio sp. Vb339 TaxID=1192013 RepID=UPI001556111B|nr:hypothetical protein [Vibrio sp. Vb339]
MLEKSSILAPNLFPFTGSEALSEKIFPYWVEDLVKYSVGRLVIKEDTYFHEFSNELSYFHEDFVKIVDWQTSFKKTKYLLEPIFRQFNHATICEQTNCLVFGGELVGDHKLSRAIYTVHHDLSKLVSSVIYKTSWDVDLNHLRDCLKVIYDRSEDKDARTILVKIESFLTGYKEVELPGVQLNPNARENSLKLLMLQAEYQMMSQGVSKLGLLNASAKKNLMQLKVSATELFKNEDFKEILEASSEVIQLNSEFRLASKFIDLILTDDYLPPVIDLSPSYARASFATFSAKKG